MIQKILLELWFLDSKGFIKSVFRLYSLEYSKLVLFQMYTFENRISILIPKLVFFLFEKILHKVHR